MEYGGIVNSLMKIKKEKDKTLSNEEMEKLLSNDELCILCYASPSDTEFQPCKHKCCQNCYNIYKVEKDKKSSLPLEHLIMKP